MTDRPGIIITRDMWNGAIIGYLNDYGGKPGGLSYLPTNQRWFRQQDLEEVRSYITTYWPNHYLRYTPNPVAKMTAFNDFYDAGHNNTVFHNGNEHVVDYIVYSQAWRERTGTTFNHFDMIGAMRAISPPLGEAWWISISATHAMTLMDNWQSNWFLNAEHPLDWDYEILYSDSWCERYHYPDPENYGEFVDDEWLDQVDDRIPTILTAQDGSRTFVSPNTGGQYTLPPTVCEPRTYFVAGLHWYTTW